MQQLDSHGVALATAKPVRSCEQHFRKRRATALLRAVLIGHLLRPAKALFSRRPASLLSNHGRTTSHPVEWLSDNGPQYTAHETRAFGKRHGLLVRNTPAYSPESNAMAEAFVKTFKRDYVYLADVVDAETVLGQIDDWFRDYNEHHPHKGLPMLSPRQFRRIQTS